MKMNAMIDRIREELAGKYKYIVLFIIVFIITFLGFLYLNNNSPAPDLDVPVFTAEQVLEYDGTDQDKPIYLIYQGYVYDVTEGRKYYEEGGSYHFLAGKDSTTELNMFGGEIIKKKYPIIGKL